jgi:hypothetical protein
MGALKKWSILLLAIPASVAGWLAGGGAPGTKPSQTEVDANNPTAIAPPVELPDFFAADSDGQAPSFIEVSLRLLRKAQTADAREWRKLRQEIDDARYRTERGYDLAQWTIRAHHSTRPSAPIRADEIPPASRPSHFLSLGMRDLRSAFEIAINAEPETLRSIILKDVFRGGARKDPMLALELLRSISDPLLRTQVAEHAVSAAAHKNPALCDELVAEFPHLRASIYQDAIGALAETDPAKALASYENAPPAHRKSIIQSILGSWAQVDHAAALAWANEHGVSPPRQLYFGWARADPVAGIEAALEADFRRAQFHGSIESVVDIIDNATYEHPENQQKVAEWLLGLEDTSLATTLSAGLLRGAMEPTESVREAARIAAEHPDCDRSTLSGFVARIRDPAERRDWVQSLPPILSRQMMLPHAREWLRDEPGGFGAYVQSLPSPRARAAFVNGALVAAGGIENATLRSWATTNLDAETAQLIQPPRDNR